MKVDQLYMKTEEVQSVTDTIGKIFNNAGTKHYMASEILKSLSSDLWECYKEPETCSFADELDAAIDFALKVEGEFIRQTTSKNGVTPGAAQQEPEDPVAD